MTDDGEAFLPLPSVRHLRILARTVGTGDTQVYVRGRYRGGATIDFRNFPNSGAKCVAMSPLASLRTLMISLRVDRLFPF